MAKLLIINSILNRTSTGKIAEYIGKTAQSHGWDVIAASGRESYNSRLNTYRIGSKFDIYTHVIKSRLFDCQGLASTMPSKQLVTFIDAYKPEHIALTNADIFVIAPCTANSLSKIANGICDNLLLSTACAFKKSILVVPAMNTGMWENPFVQENLANLKQKGINILEPNEGFLACGTSGVGRMPEVEDIFDKTVEILKPNTSE